LGVELRFDRVVEDAVDGSDLVGDGDATCWLAKVVNARVRSLGLLGRSSARSIRQAPGPPANLVQRSSQSGYSLPYWANA
jgi:hypothetical protein